MKNISFVAFLLLTACGGQVITEISTPPPENAPFIPTEASTARTITKNTFYDVSVTFIFNAGFLITVGDQRVLIDAIYEGYPEGTLKPILDLQSPFDGVDLILATHEHRDHFDPKLVLRYLQNNPETVFASNPNAVNAILTLDSSMEPRLTAIELKTGESEQLALADINIEGLYLSHGEIGIINIGYIITLGEVTFFHMGDMDPREVSVSDLQAYGLPGKQIDIAFVQEFLLVNEEFHAHILEGIQPSYPIPMHFAIQPPSGLESIFPTIITLQEPYECWVMPK
jgi:L-ascorbate metabolism protein UlaG (beta-lactamase superfamily)